MTIVKLQNEGDTLTGTVAGCEVVEGQYGEQVKFTFTDGKILYLPKSSADNQLGREQVGLTYAEAIGNTLTFSRDPNKRAGGKPYWGINVASPAMAQAAPSKRIPPPSGAAPQGRTQPFDAPTRAEMAAQHDPDAPDPWDEPTPYRQTPDDDGGIIGQPPLNAREQAVLAKAQTVEEEYLALWSRVAERQASVGKSLGLPVDGSSVQAATFSIWGLSGRGR